MFYGNYAGQNLTIDMASLKMPWKKIPAEILYIK